MLSPSPGGGTDQIYFGTDTGGLTAAQIGQVYFYSDAGLTGLGNGVLLASGELVPVPEPSTWLAAAGLLGFAGWRSRKQIKKMFSKSAEVV